MNGSVLILGSKPPAKIPKLDFIEVFSSNGSAELAKIYINKHKSVDHTCVIGARSFTKLNHIKNRVISAAPSTLVIRDYEKIYSYIPELFNNNLKVINYTTFEQILFQKTFFNSGILNLFLAEVNYEDKFLKKLKHMLSGFFINGFMGASTGFFALLYASQKYPNSNLVLSGLGFKGGGHYYNDGKMTDSRGRVDSYLLKYLNNQIKNRIYIFDKKMSEELNIKNLEAGEISLK